MPMLGHVTMDFINFITRIVISKWAFDVVMIPYEGLPDRSLVLTLASLNFHLLLSGTLWQSESPCFLEVKAVLLSVSHVGGGVALCVIGRQLVLHFPFSKRSGRNV
jgi:hypothetical protein